MASYMIDRNHKPEVCASKDQARGNLAHPWCDPQAGRIYATDGHMLVSIPAPVDMDTGLGECKAGPVSGDLLKAGRKAAPKRQGGRLALSGDRSTLSGVSMSAPSPVGNYPNVDQVIPRFLPGEDGTVSIPLDVGLLKKICEAIGDDKVILTVKVSDLDDARPESSNLPHAVRGPILVKRVNAEGVGDAFGLLMPVSADKRAR